MTVTFFSIARQTGRRIGAGRRVWGTDPSQEIAAAITLTDTNSTVQPGISSISEAVVPRFAGDSDGWMPQTGGELSLLSSLAGNGPALLPDLYADSCEPRAS